MNEIGRMFFLLIILTVSLAGYFLVLNALFAHRLAKSQHIFEQSRARSFWLGLINLLFFAVLVVALFSMAERASGAVKTLLNLPALLIAGAMTASLGFGWAAVANVIAGRFFPQSPSWMKVVMGTVILAFGGALPFAGWFLLLPYTGCAGLGAFILGFFQKEMKE